MYGVAANAGGNFLGSGTRRTSSIVLTVEQKGFIKMKKKIDLSKDIEFDEYVFIANVLNAMSTTTQQAIDSAIKKKEWDKWRRFTKYKEKCDKLEQKIRAGLEG